MSGDRDRGESPGTDATDGERPPGATKRERAHYEGDPTLIRVMLRPQWIAALLLALAVAAGFAWLGQWQLGTAIRGDDQTRQTEDVPKPLPETTEAGQPVMEAAAAAVVTLGGRLVPEDLLIVERRLHDDEMGVWLTGRIDVDAASGGGQLAVAIGWAPDIAAAERSRDALRQRDDLVGTPLALEGRYMPPDLAETPGRAADPLEITSMSPAQLVNLWQPFDGPAYAGYLVLHTDTPGAAIDGGALADLGLETIASVPALPAENVNWLNLFYAIEWVVFAGFAVFFWYRLARDAWEKEHELKGLAGGE